MNNKKVTKAELKKQKAPEFQVFNETSCCKKQTDTIIKESKKIKTSKIVSEILTWVTANVEQFIDNQKRAFKLDLIVNSEMMPETSKLQDLYRAIPYLEGTDELTEIEKKQKTDNANECREVLDAITNTIFNEMKADTKSLQELFKRMSFYYEMVGFFNGKPLVKNFGGAVDIANFEYENFSMGVKVNAPAFKIATEDGNQRLIEGNEKQYVIPEGFSVWIEISLVDSYAQKSMF